jgi:hypothetical protein
MKTTLITLLLSTLLLVGCMDNSSDLTSSDVEINQQSNSPNWVKLPADLEQDFGVETGYSAEKLIKGDKGGVIKLNVRLHQHGSEFGDHFVVKAKVKIEKHSFPDEEEKLFTITMDPDNAFLNISPSPNTLYKHITVDWEIKGIDVSNINPDTFDYKYIGDNLQILDTYKQDLRVDYDKHKIRVKKGIIYPTPPDESPGGTRYGFVH